jgi:hypothetical protein
MWLLIDDDVAPALAACHYQPGGLFALTCLSRGCLSDEAIARRARERRAAASQRALTRRLICGSRLARTQHRPPAPLLARTLDDGHDIRDQLAADIASPPAAAAPVGEEPAPDRGPARARRGQPVMRPATASAASVPLTWRVRVDNAFGWETDASAAARVRPSTWTPISGRQTWLPQRSADGR